MMDSIHAGVRWWNQVWVAIPVGVALTTAAMPASAVQDEEVLYVLTGGGQHLISFDPASLERGLLHEVGWKLSSPWLLKGLAYHANRLFSVDENWQSLPDRFVQIHPSNGDPEVLGLTGQSQTNNWAIDVDPSTGRMFAIESYARLWEFDPTSGTTTLVGDLTGAFQTFGGAALAINSSGIAIVSSLPAGSPAGPAVGVLDLTTGSARPMGRIPIGVGVFRDLAFDKNDVLWGAYADYLDPSLDGIYQVDWQRLAYRKMIDSPPAGIAGWWALAFGPASVVSGFCVASSSASGCVPAIDSLGLPSSTAPSGFEVHATGVPSGAPGVLAWGAGDAVQIPFGGATLCVDGPLQWTAVVDSGGSAPPGTDCSGTWTVDLNAEVFALGLHPPGTTLRCQWLGRDSSASVTAALVATAALELVLSP